MIMTLGEILKTCDDWEKFCDDFGYTFYAVQEGGGDVEVELTLEQAHRLGILKRANQW
jgi:hypothetical protein